MATDSLAHDISTRSSWSIFMGVLTAVIGVVLIIYPYATATVTTIFVGWAFIFAGAAQLVFAFTSDGAGNAFLNVLIAVLYAIAGGYLIVSPAKGTEALTATLGIVFIIQAAIEAAVGFDLRPLSGWGWFVFDSILSLLFGGLILAKWPSNSQWVIGTLVGCGVLVNGITRVIVSTTIHHDVSGFAKGHA